MSTRSQPSSRLGRTTRYGTTAEHLRSIVISAQFPAFRWVKRPTSIGRERRFRFAPFRGQSNAFDYVITPDVEPAGLEVDVRGQGGDLVAGLGAQGDFHGGGLEVFANAFELGHQPPTPALLIAERLAVSNGFELLDQLLAVEEESSAGLVAAEAVQQLDGLSAF